MPRWLQQSQLVDANAIVTEILDKNDWSLKQINCRNVYKHCYNQVFSWFPLTWYSEVSACERVACRRNWLGSARLGTTDTERPDNTRACHHCYHHHHHHHRHHYLQSCHLLLRPEDLDGRGGQHLVGDGGEDLESEDKLSNYSTISNIYKKKLSTELHS